VVPPAGDRRAGLSAGVDAIRGARSEVRKQLREQQRLRMWTLIALVVVVVGALPLYFVLRAATRDPVLTTLDALDVPTWAVVQGKTVDNISGSRWCLIDCRYRERSMESERAPEETSQAYQKALTDAGWTRWNVPSCVLAEGSDGQYSCWRRDEFTLDLWVRPITTPECTDLLRNRPTVGPTEKAPASAEPSAPAGSPDACKGSAITIKVQNTIDDDRLRQTGDPGGEQGAGDGGEAGAETEPASPAPTPAAS
jgi:integrin beta 3